MAAGKNKLVRYMRLLFHGYNLSGDSRKFDELSNSADAVDMLGWSDAAHNYLSDAHRNTGVKGYQALLNDATAGALTALQQTAGTMKERALSVLLGSLAEPAIGDPAYVLASVLMSDNAGLDGGAVVLQCDFMADAAQASASNDQPWGVVLHPETSLAATTNGASVNNGAATTNGLHANIHVTVSSGGTWAFKIQHSTDGAAWADLVSFTINGSAINSEHVSVAGTVNQYLRFVATRTSGSVTPFCTAARN